MHVATQEFFIGDGDGGELCQMLYAISAESFGSATEDMDVGICGEGVEGTVGLDGGDDGYVKSAKSGNNSNNLWGQECEDACASAWGGGELVAGGTEGIAHCFDGCFVEGGGAGVKHATGGGEGSEVCEQGAMSGAMRGTSRKWLVAATRRTASASTRAQTTRPACASAVVAVWASVRSATMATSSSLTLAQGGEVEVTASYMAVCGAFFQFYREAARYMFNVSYDYARYLRMSEVDAHMVDQHCSMEFSDNGFSGSGAEGEDSRGAVFMSLWASSVWLPPPCPQ